MLAIGTLDGLWIVTGELAFAKRSIRLQHTLSGTNIVDVIRLPSEEILVLNTSGNLMHRSVSTAAHWKRYPTQQLPHDVQPSHIALGFDGTLWMGTAPARLFSTHLLGPTPYQWTCYPTLHEQAEAGAWWGLQHSSQSKISSILPDHELRKSCIVTVAVGGIYLTQDEGNTWQPQHSGITPLIPPGAQYVDAHRPVQFCLCSPFDHTKLYAGTGSALYRTDATGLSWEWQDITPPTLQGWIHAACPIVLSQYTAGELYCMAPLDDDSTDLGVWKSADNGDSWQTIAHAPHIPNTANGSFAPVILISPDSPTTLIIISPNGDVYRVDPLSTRIIARNLGALTRAIWI